MIDERKLDAERCKRPRLHRELFQVEKDVGVGVGRDEGFAQCQGVFRTEGHVIPGCQEEGQGCLVGEGRGKGRIRDG